MKATIRFYTASEGGRPYPPSGMTYSAVMRSSALPPEDNDKWSLCLTYPEGSDPNPQVRSDVIVEFLSECAPSHLLRNGVEFELLEGPHPVAFGKISGSE